MVHALAGTVHAHARIIHTQNKIWDPRLKSGGFWSRSQEVGETTAADLPAAPHCEGAKAQDLGSLRAPLDPVFLLTQGSEAA